MVRLTYGITMTNKIDEGTPVICSYHLKCDRIKSCKHGKVHAYHHHTCEIPCYKLDGIIVNCIPHKNPCLTCEVKHCPFGFKEEEEGECYATPT